MCEESIFIGHRIPNDFFWQPVQSQDLVVMVGQSQVTKCNFMFQAIR